MSVGECKVGKVERERQNYSPSGSIGKDEKKMFVTKTNLYKLTCYYNFLLF